MVEGQLTAFLGIFRPSKDVPCCLAVCYTRLIGHSRKIGVRAPRKGTTINIISAIMEVPLVFAVIVEVQRHVRIAAIVRPPIGSAGCSDSLLEDSRSIRKSEG